jgi:hypothetical protein
MVPSVLSNLIQRISTTLVVEENYFNNIDHYSTLSIYLTSWKLKNLNSENY